jgi:hypothetical protein
MSRVDSEVQQVLISALIGQRANGSRMDDQRDDREGSRAAISSGRRRTLVLVWVIFSLLVAFVASVQFFVTYAPPHPGERGLEEMELMYRVTGNLAGLSYLASAMLVINGLLVAWLAWNKE